MDEEILFKARCGQGQLCITRAEVYTHLTFLGRTVNKQSIFIKQIVGIDIQPGFANYNLLLHTTGGKTLKVTGINKKDAEKAKEIIGEILTKG